METFERTCKEDVFEGLLKKGKKYTTSKIDEQGILVVMTHNGWFEVPARLFTKGKKNKTLDDIIKRK